MPSPRFGSYKRIFFAIVICYAALVGFFTAYQNKLLYLTMGNAHSETQPAADRAGLTMWPDETPNYKGFFSKNAHAQYKGTIVIAHGNASSAWRRTYYNEALEPLGYRVFLYEYPGYGSRPGKLGEKSFIADLRQTVREIKNSTSAPIYMWGESLGCGVAASAVADATLPVDGLVLLMPWDNLAAVVRTHYPFLPARWICNDTYDSVANLAQWKKPVAVLLAQNDEIIPIRHGQRLADSISGMKKVITFPGATHNNWPANPRLAWWKEVMDFVSGAESRLDSAKATR